MFNESALIKYNKEIISLSRGYPAQVVFNFEKVWDFKRRLGPEFNPDLLSFYHVHPEDCLWYSQLDLNCLQGFNAAFGFPVYFGILCYQNNNLYCNRYSEVSFRLINGEMVKQDNFSRYDLKLSLFDSLLLKGSSYAEVIDG